MTSKLSDQDIQICLQVLQNLNADGAEIEALDEETRIALMSEAGRFSRPDKLDLKQRNREIMQARRRNLTLADKKVRAATGIREARRQTVFLAPPKADGPSAPETKLGKSRSCYVCKNEFDTVHFFYDSMCPRCAEFNYQKRFQTASLEGQVALITGARLKIGYQSALMMLRAGARVIATTRFPVDAASRFAREEDYAQWSHRLQVHGLDLRHIPSVEIFCRYIEQTAGRLDLLINNAAQTVRRPAGFYTHLMELERTPVQDLKPEVAALLRSHEHCKELLAGVGPGGGVGSPGPLERANSGSGEGFDSALKNRPHSVPSTETESAKKSPIRIENNLRLDLEFDPSVDPSARVGWHHPRVGVGLTSSAELSQIPYSYDGSISTEEVFPEGRLDADLQQVDLRKKNSWRLGLTEVPSLEMLEVQLVNSVAPFVLCSRLAPLMRRDRTGQKHIVNVSAMEGKFTRYTKTDKHPHTNMAKAALNMLTLTSAPDLAKDGIFMNAVDTGWVTDEDPMDLSLSKQDIHDFEPPLDIVDGAARVCDPFFDGILTGKHWSGMFLKDYFPTDW